MIEKKEEENGNFLMEIIMMVNSNKICHMEMEAFIRKPS
jgi:hypothetical protein